MLILYYILYYFVFLIFALQIGGLIYRVIKKEMSFERNLSFSISIALLAICLYYNTFLSLLIGLSVILFSYRFINIVFEYYDPEGNAIYKKQLDEIKQNLEKFMNKHLLKNKE